MFCDTSDTYVKGKMEKKDLLFSVSFRPSHSPCLHNKSFREICRKAMASSLQQVFIALGVLDYGGQLQAHINQLLSSNTLQGRHTPTGEQILWGKQSRPLILLLTSVNASIYI